MVQYREKRLHVLVFEYGIAGEGLHLVELDPRFGDDRVAVEFSTEYLRRIRADVRKRGLARSKRGRSPDAAKCAVVHAEPKLQAPHETGEVGGLRTVERVQLVNDKILERRRIVFLPQRLLPFADEHVVEHLVVREQNLRRRLQDRVAVGDDVVLAHLLVASATVGILADVQTHVDALQPRMGVNRFRKTPRLVRRQRIHRIDDDRPDARSVPELCAIRENRPGEALRLAGAGARRHKGRLEMRRGDPVKRPRLVKVGHVRQLCHRWREPRQLRRIRGLPERQRQLQVWPLHETFRRLEEIVPQVLEHPLPGIQRKLRPQEILEVLPQLLPYDRRVHTITSHLPRVPPMRRMRPVSCSVLSARCTVRLATLSMEAILVADSFGSSRKASNTASTIGVSFAPRFTTRLTTFTT